MLPQERQKHVVARKLGKDSIAGVKVGKCDAGSKVYSHASI
jgi:hypothetical protein